MGAMVLQNLISHVVFKSSCSESLSMSVEILQWEGRLKPQLFLPVAFGGLHHLLTYADAVSV